MDKNSDLDDLLSPQVRLPVDDPWVEILYVKDEFRVDGAAAVFFS